MAFGRTNCGPPAGMCTLCTIGTGPPVSIGSSRLLLELLESLPESSESLLLDELELELARLPDCLAASAAVNPLPLGRVDVRDDCSFTGGLGGAGMDAKMAAVDDVEVTEAICGSLVGVACDCLLCPLSDVAFSGRDTMRGLVAVDTEGGFCLARATAFVIFAAATAETLLEDLDTFFTSPVLATDVFAFVLAAKGWSREVTCETPCLLSWETLTEDGGAVDLAVSSTASLHEE